MVVFSDHYIADLLLNNSVKEFLKAVTGQYLLSGKTSFMSFCVGSRLRMVVIACCIFIRVQC